jgi:hypothetical protein
MCKVNRGSFYIGFVLIVFTVRLTQAAKGAENGSNRDPSEAACSSATFSLVSVSGFYFSALNPYRVLRVLESQTSLLSVVSLFAGTASNPSEVFWVGVSQLSYVIINLDAHRYV